MRKKENTSTNQQPNNHNHETKKNFPIATSLRAVNSGGRIQCDSADQQLHRQYGGGSCDRVL